MPETLSDRLHGPRIDGSGRKRRYLILIIIDELGHPHLDNKPRWVLLIGTIISSWNTDSVESPLDLTSADENRTLP